MKRLAFFVGLAGLVGATGVIAWSGAGAVLAALEKAGLGGILVTCLAHLVPMTLCVIGWRALLGRRGPGYVFFLYVLWIRAAINNLMPVARIGGEIVSVRILTRGGVAPSVAVASTMVEITLSVIAVFLFSLLGVALFTLRMGSHDSTLALTIGLLVVIPLLAAFVIVQRIGFFGLARRILGLLFHDQAVRLAGAFGRWDRGVRILYRRRKRVLICSVFQFASWAAGSGEIALALFFLGHPVTLTEAVMIEALIQATSQAAFFVPGALGVQEAGFLVFGAALGLTPEIAGALAVIRRCRDVVLYVPGLIAWQVWEGRGVFGRRTAPVTP